MKRPIYLDYNATTPVDPRVLERMLPYFTEQFGNPASEGHPYGWTAGEAVAQAREQVAALLGAEPVELVFTGGASEAVNTAIKGVAWAYAEKGRHVVTVQTEHNAVLESCRFLEQQGYTVTYLPVDGDGRVDPAAVAAALTDETILVAVMWANNELGTLQPIPEIAQVVRSRGILLLSDATQAVGKVPVDVAHVDLLACSSHKLYGPKGVGALYVRRRNPRVRLVPLVSGGHHERGLRGGTLNVPGIVGMGAAAEIARAGLEEEGARLRALRDRLEASLVEAVPGLRVNAQHAPRLPQTSNLTFPDRYAGLLTLSLRGLAVSTSSACTSGSGAPSHVLHAIGRTDTEAAATLRFSLGRFTTAEEIDDALEQVIQMRSAERGVRHEQAPSGNVSPSPLPL